jgi:hypothetical protein
MFQYVKNRIQIGFVTKKIIFPEHIRLRIRYRGKHLESNGKTPTAPQVHGSCADPLIGKGMR